ncbi:MAG: addiction module toxin, HicA family [Methanosarcinales archaeon]|nr:MAG: addiction module toxin, HicA family [Methanosarcinales archaeon]
MKLPILSAKEIIKALKKDGFRVIRQRGTHISLYKKSENKTHPVVVPDKKRSEKRDYAQHFKASRNGHGEIL